MNSLLDAIAADLNLPTWAIKRPGIARLRDYALAFSATFFEDIDLSDLDSFELEDTVERCVEKILESGVGTVSDAASVGELLSWAWDVGFHLDEDVAQEMPCSVPELVTEIELRVLRAAARAVRDYRPVAGGGGPSAGEVARPSARAVVEAWQSFEGDEALFFHRWDLYLAGLDTPCPEMADGLHQASDGSCDQCGAKNLN